MKNLMFGRLLGKNSGLVRSARNDVPFLSSRVPVGSVAIQNLSSLRALQIFILGYSLVAGQALFAAGPSKQVVVGPEDTVYGIAYNNGIPTRSLIAANNLKPPYVLNPGQVLIIPSFNEHIVGEGETLQAVAEEYGVNVDVLAQENNIQSPSSVTSGTSLMIPPRDTESLAEALKPPSQEILTSSLAPLPLIKSSPPREGSNTLAPLASSNAVLPDDLAAELAREKGSPVEKEKVDSSSKPLLMGNLAQKKGGAPIGSSQGSEESVKEHQTPKKEVKKQEPKEEKIPEKKEAKKEDKKKEAEVKDVNFIWPVEGKVISKFSPGGENDGINIKIPAGTLVKASADGTVIYAGDGLKNFGNLILLKHKDGWVTAYGHNTDLLVQKGDKVKQGQEIAHSGKIGDVGEPQLHFEIRKVKQPVDPLTKLKS